jgi:nucleoside-diphosphate-sugar epimerase
MDAAAVREAMDGCDAVVHLASIAGVDTVMRNPVLTMRTSLLGTANVLEAALSAGRLRRVIDLSTSEVFGRYAYNVAEVDATTLGAVGEARWTYAVAKLATEHLAITYHKQHGLPACAVRPFNVFGPRQVGEGAIHHFIVRAIAGEPLAVHNDGGQIRSWCYVDDIVDGLLLALERGEACGHTFNIGNPRATITIYNLAREIVRLAGSQSRVEFVRWDHQDVELRIPNIDKARRLLGFEPRVDLEDGIVRTIAWYRARQ